MLNQIQQESDQKSLYSLQILRAVAATSVVYYHIEENPRFGSFGVDIFFVISGFVMAMIIANGQSARTFCISRIARILPLYWILTTCVLLLAALKPELLNSTTANIANYLKSIFFIPYFKENGALHPMLAVGWTLNYEMFFYLCVWIAIIISRKLLFPLTLMLLTLAYVMLGKQTENSVLTAFFGSTLLFEFSLGMLAYHIHQRFQSLKIPAFLFVIATCLSYALMAYFEIIGTQMDRFWAYGLPSFVLVLSMIFLENSVFSKEGMINNVLTSMGDASYATYLSHAYVVEGMRKIIFPRLNGIDIYNPLGVLITITVALIAGQLIYKFCDKPLSTYVKRWLLSRFPSNKNPAL
jgi:exopolysaccharide production protein ExoZ